MKKHSKIALTGLICTVVTAANCQTKSILDSPSTPKDFPKEKTHGLIISNMDPTVSPKEDFYQFVNGNWQKNTKIPEDRTRWGGFGILREATDKDVLEIIHTAKKNNTYSAETDQAKALALFTNELDSISRNQLGLTPLKSSLEALDKVTSVAELQSLASTSPIISTPFMGLSSFADLNDSSVNAAYIGPNGLGLPDRDYYLEQDEKSKETREKYKAYISTMLQKLGDSKVEADKSAATILALETKLAEPRLTKVERRDTRKLNNPMSIQEVQKLIPSIKIDQLLSDNGVAKALDTIMVTQPKYMKKLDELLINTPIEDLKTLVKWDTFNSSTGLLSKEIEKESWLFYSNYLRGAKKQRDVEERALATINGSLGEALGQLYVDKKFPPEAKFKAEKMIDNVITAFKGRIEKLEWMSDSTKQNAIRKLNKLTVKIAYPDKWEDYSKLDLKEEDGYFKNRIAIREWSKKKNIAKIGEPVDKSKWGMAPQVVNAYFHPLNNEIVFPAAILQSPFYDYRADEAVNYGGIGAVIGHEISHAFDDSGARFDENGNLNNWWNESDLEQFNKRGNQLAEQYSAIEVMDSLPINGKFTLGENIGDLGGVLGAYDGLQLFYKKNGRPNKIDGFTPEQRFFISWATVWRTLTREEALRTQIKTDPHSPGIVRATQPLKNIDAFYKAFDITKNDAMYIKPEDRVRIW
ncbi:M13 family metallopeptidase [Aquimarina agarivorans]|uniref:M13 family metallopeptidase n=1 Tax=Aquimarina agarivorans TaxID=980584 RepID=UPI000248ED21|nr:M13 family metallopeptidase [Aquimarina agarivorans]